MSSAQPRDLSALIDTYNPDLVLVKGYQPQERAGTGFTTAMTQQVTKDQVASTLANGKTPYLYLWLYADLDPERAIDNVLDLGIACGLPMRLVGIDVETYGAAHAIPSAATVRVAHAHCDSVGVEPLTYSSVSMWALIGNPSMPGRKAWVAGGPLYHVGGDPPVALNIEGFGGMTVTGWQWTSNPLDQSVFENVSLP